MILSRRRSLSLIPSRRQRSLFEEIPASQIVAEDWGLASSGSDDGYRSSPPRWKRIWWIAPRRSVHVCTHRGIVWSWMMKRASFKESGPGQHSMQICIIPSWQESTGSFHHIFYDYVDPALKFQSLLGKQIGRLLYGLKITTGATRRQSCSGSLWGKYVMVAI